MRRLHPGGTLWEHPERCIPPRVWSRWRDIAIFKTTRRLDLRGLEALRCNSSEYFTRACYTGKGLTGSLTKEYGGYSCSATRKR